MENLKIKNTKTNEILKNLTELGYIWTPTTHDSDDCLLKSIWIITESNGEIFYSSKDEFVNEDNHKEVTIPELLDMVVLKRNSVDDANYTCDREKKYYVTGNDVYMYIHQGVWSLCEKFPLEKAIEHWKLKPIKKQKTMKEWIYKDGSGEYVLTTDPEITNLAADAVEVPNGAQYMTMPNYYFWRDQDPCAYDDVENNWNDNDGESMQDYLTGAYSAKIVWQREKPQEKCADICGDVSVNDVQLTLAEREKQYGSFSNVAELTCNLMGDLVRTDMSFVQREALHMICSKLARIRCGDVNKIDSWHDIAGYATLVVKDLEKKAIDADKIKYQIS